MRHWVTLLFLPILLVSCRSNGKASQLNVVVSEIVSYPTVTNSQVPNLVTTMVSNAPPTGHPGTEQLPITTTVPVSTSDEIPSLTVTIPQSNYVFPSIYGWTTEGDFGYFDLTVQNSNPWRELKSGDYDSNQQNEWKSLNFSLYKDNIAYLIATDVAELWISDLDLKHPERV
jgi:hypothetical protein